MRVRIARDELRRLRELTQAINALEAEIAELVAQVAPQLLDEPGFGPLTAAKLVGEIAGAARFSSDAKLRGRVGAHPGQLRAHRSPPARSRRQPSDQRRHSPRGGHPGALSRRDDRVRRTQEGRGQDPPRGRPVAQASPRPPHLAPVARSRPAIRNNAPPINSLTKEQQEQSRGRRAAALSHGTIRGRPRRGLDHARSRLRKRKHPRARLTVVPRPRRSSRSRCLRASRLPVVHETGSDAALLVIVRWEIQIWWRWTRAASR